MRGLLLALSASLLCATAAGAQDAAPATEAEEPGGWDAIVLSYGGDATEDQAAAARDAATATLEAEGFRVLPEAEVTARIAPSRLRSASSLDALRAIGDELGTSGVVTVAVWTSDDEPSSVAISIATGGRSFSGSAEVETDLAAATATAVRAALERQRRALVVGGGTTETSETAETHAGTAGSGDGAPVEGDPWADGTPAPAEDDDGPEELFGIIGPAFLLAIGGAGLGLGVYGVLDGTCDLRSPTGECVRGEEPNLALGTLFIVGGSIAAIGAVLWWITDAVTSPEPRIDVVDLDLDVFVLDGGAAGVVSGDF